MKLTIEVRNTKGLIEEIPLHLCPTSVVQSVIESNDSLETYCQWVINHFGMIDYVDNLKKELKEHTRRKRKIIWTFSA
jgi:hypothetical protein